MRPDLPYGDIEMNDAEIWTGEVQQRMRVLQILYAALIGGALVFAGIAMLVSVAMVEQSQEDPTAGPIDVTILRYAWFGVFAFSLIGVILVRKVMPKYADKEFAPPGQAPVGPFGPFFMMSILTAAILEGTSIFGSTILLLGDQPLDLALGLVPLAIMLPFFPTRSGFARFCNPGSAGEDPERGLRAPARDHRRYR